MCDEDHDWEEERGTLSSVPDVLHQDVVRRLVANHLPEYRKLVQAADVEHLRSEIEREKARTAAVQRKLTQVTALNPDGANVPALQETVKHLMAGRDEPAYGQTVELCGLRVVVTEHAIVDQDRWDAAHEDPEWSAFVSCVEAYDSL